MSDITGIHHITCIAGDAQQNFDFYTTVLGMRLVKKSVNQDAPDTYHLFYADGEAHPGADLTFFPWGNAPRGRKGIGLASEIALAIPAGSLEFWTERLTHFGVATKPAEVRRGDRALPLIDPDGLEVALVETSDERDFVPWDKSPVSADRQILGLHAVRLWERDLDVTATFLTGILGFKAMGEVDGWHRFGLGDGG